MSLSITYYSFNALRADQEWQMILSADLKKIWQQLQILKKESDDVSSQLRDQRGKKTLLGMEYFLQEFNDLSDYDRGDLSKRPAEDIPMARLDEILKQTKELEKQLGNYKFSDILSLCSDNVEDSEIIRALVYQDLKLGSIDFELEDTSWEQEFIKMIELLNDSASLSFSSKIRTKDWIFLMQKVTVKAVNNFFRSGTDEPNPTVGEIEFRNCFLDYIRGIRPLMKDCKTNGSVIVIDEEGNISYDGFLLEQSPLYARAVEHYQRIRERLV
ncbi:MAG: hypothetical protein G01um101418_757 [Parcubacteria group bacterium Gr01-1014_18]|nr:MAG: hypothetical protein Greene041636_773 [Parcubacteria group bacterium Greene0416_36]TSC80122.1 MAG: hypothetical protein G01um101418_757 [Parcubacteria group bacterium Gr01-1014_18]TSC99336.1 MAG: hypothetical protein Greene101420_264 [Parcubacteria group bacterium Greene1014_20]TSD06827.1 MAG: hypothetical protein Greene07142_561 [Parcubacteria group bacterium Greene0714_2]